ncbi:MAG: hypothetical protein DRP71_09840 [Verrucomicrobia bacterium]|nr:MAG: hypothetical protein DRP71_09840 [Verrucomicrobiota bacterium]
MHSSDRLAWAFYVLGIGIMALGIGLAVWNYPGEFDWTRDVISGLASRKYNPKGGIWLSGALGVSMGLLWPVVDRLRAPDVRRDRIEWISIGALRCGLVFGMLVAIERLAVRHLSDQIYQAHEALAFATFLCLFCGTLGLSLQVSRRGEHASWAFLSVSVPLAAIGISQLLLYLRRRGAGWTDKEAEADIPTWLSFAFWQWLAIVALWASVGLLLIASTSEVPKRPPKGAENETGS